MKYWLKVFLVIVGISALWTPLLTKALNGQRRISSERLHQIHSLIVERDKALTEYMEAGLRFEEATTALDIGLATTYSDYRTDRLKYDLDLNTGKFIPYREGRSPKTPPTFQTKEQQPNGRP